MDKRLFSDFLNEMMESPFFKFILAVMLILVGIMLVQVFKMKPDSTIEQVIEFEVKDLTGLDIDFSQEKPQ
jgi:hypothetical protein